MAIYFFIDVRNTSNPTQSENKSRYVSVPLFLNGCVISIQSEVSLKQVIQDVVIFSLKYSSKIVIISWRFIQKKRVFLAWPGEDLSKILKTPKCRGRKILCQATVGIESIPLYCNIV